MKLSKRDGRALAALGAVVVIILVVEMVVARRGEAPATPSIDSVAAVERRLARVKQAASALPAMEADLAAVSAALTERERGVLQADTLPQAQAQLLQVVRRISSAQSPPVDIRSVELGRARPLADDYGEISVPIVLQCRIEQLVNLLADLTAQPELLATGDMRLSEADQKEKTINVRLTLTAVVPRRLVPERRGPGAL